MDRALKRARVEEEGQKSQPRRLSAYERHQVRVAQRLAQARAQREPWKVFYRQQPAFDEADRLNEAGERGQAGVVVFALETGSQGQRQFIVSTYEGLWNKVCLTDPTRRHFYEVIREHQPVHLYFDLEFQRRENPEADGPAMVVTFLQRLRQELLADFGVELDLERDVLDLESSTATKFSRHLVCKLRTGARATMFRNNIHAGVWVVRLCARIEADAQFGDSDMQSLLVLEQERRTVFVDQGVYTRNRCFRLYLSSKFSKKHAILRDRAHDLGKQVPLGATTHQSKRNKIKKRFMNTLVCYPHGKLPPAGGASQDDGAFVRLLECDLPTTTVVSSDVPGKPSRRTSKSHSGSSDSSPSPFPDVDRFVSQQLARFFPGQAGAFLKSWRAYGEPCSTLTYQIGGTRYCNKVGREHRSNGVIVVADLRRRVAYQKCHDPRCAGFRSQELALPPSFEDEELDAILAEFPLDDVVAAASLL